MNDKQLKRLAEIVLTQRLIICSMQRTLRNVYEEATKSESQNENVRDVISEFDKLEPILKKIECEDHPRDCHLFELDDLGLTGDDRQHEPVKIGCRPRRVN